MGKTKKFLSIVFMVICICILSYKSAYADIAAPPVFVGLFVLFLLGIAVIVIIIISYFIIKWIKRKSDHKHSS